MKRIIRTKKSDINATIDAEVDRRVREQLAFIRQQEQAHKALLERQVIDLQAEVKELNMRLQRLRERLPKRMLKQHDEEIVTRTTETVDDNGEPLVVEEYLDPQGRPRQRIRRDITMDIVSTQQERANPRSRRRRT